MCQQPARVIRAWSKSCHLVISRIHTAARCVHNQRLCSEAKLTLCKWEFLGSGASLGYARDKFCAEKSRSWGANETSSLNVTCRLCASPGLCSQLAGTRNDRSAIGVRVDTPFENISHTRSPHWDRRACKKTFRVSRTRKVIFYSPFVHLGCSRSTHANFFCNALV